MDGFDQTTSLEGHPSTGPTREAQSTIPDHATATGVSKTTEVFGCGKSPLESIGGDDLSVQAADPMDDLLCLNAKFSQMRREQYLRGLPEDQLSVPRNFCQVSSVSSSMWKDQRQDKKEELQLYVKNLLDFYHNKREEEKRMNSEKE